MLRLMICTTKRPPICRVLACLLVSLALGACAREELSPARQSPPPGPVAKLAAAPSPIRSSPELLALRDPRRIRTGRPRALLVTEIQGQESLFAAMPKDSPDRSRLMHRLAESYVELARAAEADRDAQQSAPDRQAEAARAERIRRAAHSAGARYYTALAQTYPDWCVAPGVEGPVPGAPCAAEAWYFAGYGCEASGQLDCARKAYLQALQAGGLTRFVPYAYLAFGELFIAEAESKPAMWELAYKSFEEVLKFPPPDNRVNGYAFLRLGQIRLRAGDRQGARVLFTTLRSIAAASPGSPAEIAARLLPPDT
jgi:tetratricopeptide (TPR) repeat protein